MIKNRVKLHILAIDTGNEADAIRSAAEGWAYFVTVDWIGNSQDFVDSLSSSPNADIIIIAGHGDERGICLPELAEEIKHKYPYDDVVTSEELKSFLKLKNNLVINLACMSGTEALAKAFLEAGAKTYIGPTDYCEGDASQMYALELLYNYHMNKGDISSAHEVASGHKDDRAMFKIFGKE